MFIVFFVLPVVILAAAVFAWLAAIVGAALLFGASGAIAVFIVICFGVIIAAVISAMTGLVLKLRSGARSYIKPIAPGLAPPAEIAGAKGASLYRLLKAGCNVPRGFIITTAALEKIAKTPETGPPENVSWPVKMFKLKRALWNRFDAEQKLIVRSSFVVEDSPSASYAGVFESIKEVPARDITTVVDAVICVYSSYWAERAAAYREKMKIPEESAPRAAVIVQEEIKTDWNGIAFSVNPATGFKEEAVVEAAHKENKKSVRAIFNRLTRQWTFDETGEENKTVLQPHFDEILKKLYTLESDSDTPEPVQVEWGLRGDELFFFQVRPATALREVKTFTNSYIVDTPPYPLTLLSISVLEKIAPAFSADDSGDQSSWQTFNSRIHVDVEKVLQSNRPSTVADIVKAIPGGIRMLSSFLKGSGAYRRNTRTAANLSGASFSETINKLGPVIARGFELQAVNAAMYLMFDNAINKLKGDGRIIISGDGQNNMSAQLKSKPLELAEDFSSSSKSGETDLNKNTSKLRIEGINKPDEALFNWLPAAIKILHALKCRADNNRIDIHKNLAELFETIRKAARSAGESLAATGVINDPKDVFYLAVDELNAGAKAGITPEEISFRKRSFRDDLESSAQPVIHTFEGNIVEEPEAISAGDNVLRGVGNGRGTASGLAISPGAFVRLDKDAYAGKILVIESASSDWISWMPHVAGLVVETGGLLSHLLVVAAEFGVPAVTGVPGADEKISNGQYLNIDSAAGTVAISEKKYEL